MASEKESEVNMQISPKRQSERISTGSLNALAPLVHAPKVKVQNKTKKIPALTTCKNAQIRSSNIWRLTIK